MLENAKRKGGEFDDCLMEMDNTVLDKYLVKRDEETILGRLDKTPGSN